MTTPKTAAQLAAHDALVAAENAAVNSAGLYRRLDAKAAADPSFGAVADEALRLARVAERVLRAARCVSGAARSE